MYWQIHVDVQDLHKMKYKIITTCLMIFLMVNIAFAFDYEIVSYDTYEVIHNKTIQKEVYNSEKNITEIIDVEVYDYTEYIENLTSIPRYSYYSEKLGRYIENNLESQYSYDEDSYDSYEEYLQFKMQENENMWFNLENPILNITIIDETLFLEDYDNKGSWLVGVINKVIEKIEEIIFRVDTNEVDIKMLEDELCKKDNTYKFCNPIGELE